MYVLSKKISPKYLIASGVWITLLVAVFSLKVIYHIEISDLAQYLYTLFHATVFGPVLFVVLYTMRPITLIPPAIFTIIAGATFGLVEGVLYVTLGESASSMVAYFIGNFFGGAIQGDVPSRVRMVLTKVRTYPFFSVLASRLMYVPFDVTNYICGAMRIPLKSFLPATILGMFPGVVAFVSFGASITNIENLGKEYPRFDVWMILTSLGVLAASLSVAALVKLYTDKFKK